MSPPELEWLMDRACSMDSVAEIGCLHGRSAYAIASACRGPVYCIDPWNDEGDHCYASFLLNVCAEFEHVVPIREFSPAAAALVPDIDMTFIDGAHAYGDVLADIAAWLPKTRELICGHDYQNEDGGYPGVAEAVHAVFGDRVRCDADVSIWYVDLREDRSVREDAPWGPLTYTNEYGRTVTADIRWTQ